MPSQIKSYTLLYLPISLHSFLQTLRSRGLIFMYCSLFNSQKKLSSIAFISFSDRAIAIFLTLLMFIIILCLPVIQNNLKSSSLTFLNVFSLSLPKLLIADSFFNVKITLVFIRLGWGRKPYSKSS